MYNHTPTLTHSEQQVAAERIHDLMATGISSGEARSEERRVGKEC